MGAVNDIFAYLVQTFLNLYLFAMLLRFLLQLVRADFYNPICQFLVKITNPLVLPLRKIIPGVGGLDTASLLLAYLLQITSIAALVYIKLGGLPPIVMLMISAAIGLIALAIKIYFFAIVAMIIVSWVAPGSRHPGVYLLFQITEPVMAPFRNIIPPLGGLDLSPIFVIIAINVVLMALGGVAEAAGVLGITPWLGTPW
ncbi:MAG: YggT family protein [Pseudomonadota bacterium]